MASGRTFAFAALAAALAALAPLASAGEPPPAPPPTPEEQAAVFRYFAAKLEEVRRLLDQGQFEKALALARAIEELAPEGVPEAARELKTRARDALQSALEVRGAIEPPGGFLEVGDPVRLRVVVSNLAGVPLDVDLGSGPRGASFLRVEVRLEGSQGEVRAEQWDAPIPGFEGRRVIAPGAAWEAEVALDTAALSPLAPALRTYRVSGTVRPVSMTSGDRPLVRPIGIPETVFRVYPKGLGPMRRAPLETLKEGVEEELGPKIFLSAWFVPPDEAARAAADLAAALQGSFEDPSVPRAIRAAVRVLLGRPDVPLDPDAWRRWWAENGEAVAGGKGGGK